MLSIKLKKHILNTLIIASTLLSFNNSTYAGISEYNAAMAAGDYAEAAKQTVDAWKSIDTAKATSPAVARDFAFINYLVADYKTAKIFSDALVDKRSDLAKNDDQPLVSHVLASLIDFSDKDSRGTRKALLESLEARLDDPSVDRVAVIAAQKLLSADWQDSRFADVQKSSEIASEFYSRQGESSIVEKFQSEFMGIIADFVRKKETKTFSNIVRKNTDTYPNMVALQNNIVDAGVNSEDPALLAKLSPLRWNTSAWAVAMRLYSETVLDESHKMTDPLKMGNNRKFISAADAYADDPRDLCELDSESFNGQLINFPSVAAYQGMFGAVYATVDIDENGNAKNPTILSAVPDAIFGQAVLDAAPKFKIRTAPGESGKNCRLERSNEIFSVGFAIQ